MVGIAEQAVFYDGLILEVSSGRNISTVDGSMMARQVNSGAKLNDYDGGGFIIPSTEAEENRNSIVARRVGLASTIGDGTYQSTGVEIRMFV